MACTGKLVKSQKPQLADILYYLTMRLKESMKVLANMSEVGVGKRHWLDVTQ
jgi:hypothetical protein